MSHTAFEPHTLGSLTLANHIVMAPMTRSRALGNIPNELMVEYYRQRASAGLIVTEGTAPAPDGLGYSRIPGLFDADQVAGWRRVTDAVHQQGSHIFVQLMHTGRMYHPLNLPVGAEGVAPSAVAAAGQMWTDQEQLQPQPVPRALGTEELARVRDEFARSATLAMDAGFDGVELHAANGYLLEQFLHPLSNQRTDRYGGSVTNRARFVLDVTRAVAEVIGADRTGIRLSPWGVLGDMPHYEEIDETYEYLAAELQQLGVVYVHLVNNGSSAGLALPALTVEAIRGRFRRTLIINGGLHSLDAIDESLDTGHADLVAVGRPFVANPDFVERLSAGVPLAALEPATLFAPGPRGFADGYTDYPRATPPRTLAAA